MVRRLNFCVALFLLLGASAVRGQESTRTGKHFRVICHFENDSIAREALKTAEMAWPVATKLLALADGAPEKPAEIHLFRTLKDYEKADSELTGGAFRRNLAFSHWATRASYILLQPDCSDDTLKSVGLPALTRRLIAHEATHLVRCAIMPNYRSHPSWLADGAATWVEQQVMTDGRWSPGAEDDPHMSTMILQTVALLEKSDLPSVADILRDRIDDVHWQTRYAIRWLLFRFLISSVDPATFHSIMSEARRLGGGSQYSQRLNAFIEKALGPAEMKTIDGRFKAYLRGLTPHWEEVYRSLDTAGGRWTQIAFTDMNAIAWRTEPVEKEAYTLEGRLKIFPGRNRQLNLLLGRNPKGFVSVAFTAGADVTIFHYHAKENRWERLGSAKSNVLKLDRWIRFRAEVGGDQLRVTLGTRRTLTVSLNGRSMRGPWGLGAQSGSAGMWRKVGLK